MTNARAPQTVKEIEACIGDLEIAQIEALGQTRDHASKQIAEKALLMIQEWIGVSRKAVYGFYAKHTGTSAETIRKDVRMLELIPAEYWTRFEVLGISYFRHVTHFGERMESALQEALEKQYTVDEFMLVFPRVEDEAEREVVEYAKVHEYTYDFVPLLRRVRELDKFTECKPHLDALRGILKVSMG